jgi:hypothetical protein
MSSLASEMVGVVRQGKSESLGHGYLPYRRKREAVDVSDYWSPADARLVVHDPPCCVSPRLRHGHKHTVGRFVAMLPIGCNATDRVASDRGRKLEDTCRHERCKKLLDVSLARDWRWVDARMVAKW